MNGYEQATTVQSYVTYFLERVSRLDKLLIYTIGISALGRDLKILDNSRRETPSRKSLSVLGNS